MHSIYLCGSISNAHVNNRVASDLRLAGFDVFDPCTIHPQHTEKLQFSEQVFETCKRAIENCDVLFVFLDTYGKDSAWEVGFARGLGKCVVGVVTGSSLFLQDWMVKFTFDRILVIEGSWLSDAIQAPEWSSIQSRCELTPLDHIARGVLGALQMRKM